MDGVVRLQRRVLGADIDQERQRAADVRLSVQKLIDRLKKTGVALPVITKG